MPLITLTYSENFWFFRKTHFLDFLSIESKTYLCNKNQSSFILEQLFLMILKHLRRLYLQFIKLRKSSLKEFLFILLYYRNPEIDVADTHKMRKYPKDIKLN